jgi:biotin transport system substrate-specific component
MDFEVDGGVLADRKRVLVDILPRTVLIDSVLVLSFAVLIGLSAQVVIHLGFTPVPITGQTFALLLGAASLGTRRALAGSGLYVLAGMLGVPWFAGWTGGMKITASPTFGYLVGFFYCCYRCRLLCGTRLGKELFFDGPTHGNWERGDLRCGSQLARYQFGTICYSCY